MTPEGGTTYAVFVITDDGEGEMTCGMPGLTHEHLVDAEREARGRADAGQTCMVVKIVPVSLFHGAAVPPAPN